MSYIKLAAAGTVLALLVWSHIFTYTAGKNADAKADVKAIKKYQDRVSELTEKLAEAKATRETETVTKVITVRGSNDACANTDAPDDILNQLQ